MSGGEVYQARLKRLRRLHAELPLFAEKCLKIKDKAGKIVPLRFNESQLYLHERLEQQKRATGKVRAIIAKGRQTTISTYVSARFYHKTSLNRGVETFILTHEQDATDNLFGMVSRFYEHSQLRPSTGASNAKELLFDKLDSGYSVGTAGNKAVGRSKTIRLFDGSEVAFWANAKAHFAGVVQTVPDLAGTEIILESTGNGVGGEFMSAGSRLRPVSGTTRRSSSRGFGPRNIAGRSMRRSSSTTKRPNTRGSIS